MRSLIDLPSLQTINLSHRSLCGKEGVPSCSLTMRSTNGIVRMNAIDLPNLTSISNPEGDSFRYVYSVTLESI